MRTWVATAGLLCLGGFWGAWQDPETKKKAVRDIDLVGSWVYDDLNAGYALAKKTNKPMLIVFR